MYVSSLSEAGWRVPSRTRTLVFGSTLGASFDVQLSVVW
jgi:hypothetical protein